MNGVREYAEGYPVTLETYQARTLFGDRPIHPEAHGRLVISATNEGGYNGVTIDAEDLLAWFAAHRPDLLTAALDKARR